MSSAWKRYVDEALEKERSITFNEEELKCVALVRHELAEKNYIHAWNSFDHEMQLNVIRGYWNRKHRVRDMVKMTIEIYDWRKKNGIDDLLTKRMPLHDIYHSLWPSYVAGEDKYGHWIVFDKVTELQTGALVDYDEETVLLYRAQCLEAFVRLKQEVSTRLGYRVCQYIYMIDLSGLSLKKHFTNRVRSLLQPLFAMSGDYYPDSLWSLFIINAPLSFRMIWRIITPWIDPEVKPKIRILAGESSYIPAMEKMGIPIESIPAQMGGKAECTMVKDIVEAIIDSPEVEDHGFTTNPCPSDPAAVAAHKKQEKDLELFNSIAKRLSKKLGFNPDKKKRFSENSSSMAIETDDFDYNGDDVIMSGFFSKKGVKNTAWKKRFFVLTSSGLYYFTSKLTKENSGLVPRGKIELYMITTVTGDIHGEDGILIINTPGRVFELRVERESLESGETVAQATRRWLKAISNAHENDICALDVEALTNDRHEKNLFQGYLEKRGVFNSSWRRRYFVLTTNAIYYYNDIPTQVGSSLKGRVDIYRISGVDINSENPSEFSVTVPGRVFLLRTMDNKELAEKWVENISSAVKQQQQKAERKAQEEDDEDEEDDDNEEKISGNNVQPPMVRSFPEDDEEFNRPKRSNSTIVDHFTSLAADFLSVANEFGILRQSDDLPDFNDQQSTLQALRKRAFHMFKLF